MRLALATALALLATGAQYPPPSDPGELPPPPPDGSGPKLWVCKKPRCFQTIQQAVDAAGTGDTVRVANGTYRGRVRVSGHHRRGLRIVGNPRRPGRVVLKGRGRTRNAFVIDGADHVTIKGFEARNQRANGFVVRDAVGFTLSRLIARRTGAHGVHVVGSRGGTIARSRASGATRAGFRIAQTPEQVKPRRTFVRGITAHDNAVGLAGPGIRHATIAGSTFRSNERFGLLILDATGVIVSGNRFANPRDIAYGGGGGGENCFDDNGTSRNDLPGADGELPPCRTGG